MSTLDNLIDDFLKEMKEKEDKGELPFIEVFTEEDKKVNEYIKFKNDNVKKVKGRRKTEEIKVMTSKREKELLKGKLIKNDLTAQKLLHDFIIDYIMSDEDE